MSGNNQNKSEITRSDYLKYLSARLKKTDYQVEKKIKAIDELNKLVSLTRKNYRKKK